MKEKNTPLFSGNYEKTGQHGKTDATPYAV